MLNNLQTDLCGLPDHVGQTEGRPERHKAGDHALWAAQNHSNERQVMQALERPATLTEIAVERIGEAIIRGELAGGNQLAEVALAEQLHTSRGTVRAALRELDEMGLVEISPHRGAFVSELSFDVAQEIVTLRVLLESYSARLVGGLDRNPQLVSDLEALLEEQRAAAEAGDLMGLVRSDMAFHECLAIASGHVLLVEHIRSLQPQSRRFIVHVRQYGVDLEDVVTSHLPILEAVRNPSPDRLESAVRDHIMTSGELLLAKLKERSE